MQGTSATYPSTWISWTSNTAVRVVGAGRVDRGFVPSDLRSKRIGYLAAPIVLAGSDVHDDAEPSDPVPRRSNRRPTSNDRGSKPLRVDVLDDVVHGVDEEEERTEVQPRRGDGCGSDDVVDRYEPSWLSIDRRAAQCVWSSRFRCREPCELCEPCERAWVHAWSCDLDANRVERRRKRAGAPAQQAQRRG